MKLIFCIIVVLGSILKVPGGAAQSNVIDRQLDG